MRTCFSSLMIGLLLTANALAGGKYYTIEVEPSGKPGELQLGVTYTIWVPDAPRLRGVIVHQHGAGAPACAGGATAAYDLHWQALAKKWDCALLGPSYHQRDDQNSRLWSDPRQGSEQAFLKALEEFAVQSKHPELARVPWCLWGHSAGGFWSNIMTILHPERVVAAWLRSGSAALWKPEDAPPPTEIPAAVYGIPMMCNPGVKEKDDPRFGRVWTGVLGTFQSYRAKGAPIGFAPDPRTSHQCGDSRYLAILFFDVCMEMRLPERGAKDQGLKDIDQSRGWLGEPLGSKVVAVKHQIPPGGGTPELKPGWLPNERVARAWAEYVQTGAVGDSTPPPAPTNVKAEKQADGAMKITWDAEADFESGLGGFVIMRDGKEIARVPEKPVGKFGRPLFQTMSYHDTPEKPLPEMVYVDRAGSGEKHEYHVISINSVGLRSRN